MFDRGSLREFRQDCVKVSSIRSETNRGELRVGSLTDAGRQGVKMTADPVKAALYLANVLSLAKKGYHKELLELISMVAERAPGAEPNRIAPSLNKITEELIKDSASLPVESHCKLYSLVELYSEYGSADATFNLALLHNYGIGTDKSHGQYLQLVFAADAAGSLDAHVEVGTMHEVGYQVAFDPVKAIEHYEYAAGKDNIRGLLMTAKVFIEGSIAPLDLEKAYALISRAATFGSTQALYNLGKLERDGVGTEANLGLAVEHLVMAARRGHPQSMTELAIIHEQDLSGAFDADVMVGLYRAAIAKGDETAKCNLGSWLLENWRDESERLEGFQLLKELAASGHTYAIAGLELYSGSEPDPSLN